MIVVAVDEEDRDEEEDVDGSVVDEMGGGG